jgi:hypothetical protein
MPQVENWVDVESTSGQKWVGVGSYGGIWQTWGDVDITLGPLIVASIAMSPDSLTPAQLVSHSYMNRAEVEQSAVCGCFNCIATYAPAEVVLWADSTDPSDEDPGALRTDHAKFKGYTAVCPRCENTSVLGSACGELITEELLRRVHAYWCRN